MNILRLIALLLLGVVSLVVTGAGEDPRRLETKKGGSLCAWQTATTPGKTREVKTKRKDVEKKVNKRWRRPDGGLIGGSVVVVCDQFVYMLLDTGRLDDLPSYPIISSDPLPGECEVVFYTPSSTTDVFAPPTPIRAGVSPKMLAILKEGLQAMLGFVGMHKVTCGQT